MRKPTFLMAILLSASFYHSDVIASFDVTYMCRVKTGPIGSQTLSNEVLVITSAPIEINLNSYADPEHYYRAANIEGVVFTMTRHRDVLPLGTDDPYDDIAVLPPAIGRPTVFDPSLSLGGSNVLVTHLESGNRYELKLRRRGLETATLELYTGSATLPVFENLHCYPPRLRTLDADLEGSVVPPADTSLADASISTSVTN